MTELTDDKIVLLLQNEGFMNTQFNEQKIIWAESIANLQGCTIQCAFAMINFRSFNSNLPWEARSTIRANSYVCPFQNLISDIIVRLLQNKTVFGDQKRTIPFDDILCIVTL